MEQGVCSIWILLHLILVLSYFHCVAPNAEVKALTAFKSNLVDPDGHLRNWKAAFANPCSWPHVTCENEQTVIKLNLGNFKLSGQLAPELGQLSNLQVLALYNNDFNGTIPHELGNLTKLNYLDLSSNNLSGPVPDTIGNLPGLEILKLNNNSLSSEIPRSLTVTSSLHTLDLSFNQLTGDVPVNGSFSKFTISSFTGNPNLRITTIELLPSSLPGRKNPIGAIAGGVSAGVALLIVVCVLILALRKHRKVRDEFIDIPNEEHRKLHPGQPKKFSLQELQIATESFSDGNFIGRGGYANVYKGRLADGTLVAIKRLKKECAQGGEIQFQTEVEMISMAIHRNLIRLHGYCTTPEERLLVYPLMPNGSVASCLRERTAAQAPLSWKIRRSIAQGVAGGLAYLHEYCSPKIIHRDVKTDNIFLDEKYEAVVGDFGLAKLMDCKHTYVTTKVCGTFGHIAPEYFCTGKSSAKTDVFGYGAMLLEVITGQRASDLLQPTNKNDITWLDWVKRALKDKKLEELIDPALEGNYDVNEVEQLIKIALLCRQHCPKERPKMSEVVRMLEGGDGLSQRWMKWEEEEMLCHEKVKHIHHSNLDPDFDSTSNLSAYVLSGPR